MAAKIFSLVLHSSSIRKAAGLCILAASAAVWLGAPALAQRQRLPLNITGYVINAEIDTATHHLAATAVVTFTPQDEADSVSFGFHPALKVEKITDDSGKLLTGERLADGTIRVTPSAPLSSTSPLHWTSTN